MNTKQNPAKMERNGQSEWGNTYTVYVWSTEHDIYRELVAGVSYAEARLVVAQHNHPLTAVQGIKYLANHPGGLVDKGARIHEALYALETAVLEVSKHGDPDQSLQDWLTAGEYDGTETVASIVTEWDGNRDD